MQNWNRSWCWLLLLTAVVVGALVGRAEVAVVLRLLLRSARPLLDALDAWLEHGLLTDSKEFFICSGPFPPQSTSLQAAFDMPAFKIVSAGFAALA